MTDSPSSPAQTAERKKLTPAAERALAEADARRKAAAASATPHQGAVAIGQRLQPGMRPGAVKLVVEGAVLVQYAVEYIGRDPPCRETGHFGRYCESGRWHEAATSRKAERFWLMPLE